MFQAHLSLLAETAVKIFQPLIVSVIMFHVRVDAKEESMILLQEVLYKRAKFIVAAVRSCLRMRRVFGSTNLDAKEESMVLYGTMLSVAIKL